MTAGNEVVGDYARSGILVASPPAGGDRPPIAAGTHALSIRPGRDALLYVPKRYEPGRLAPLLVLLHGAGGRPPDIVPLFVEGAEAKGILVLAPQSRGRTWDVILGGYGVDVSDLDRALSETFARCAVDPVRIGIGGFSDGASYALSLGLINGETFRDILAFSPGFAAPTRAADTPRVFISHGVHDAVLPIDPCSRRLVPRLRQDGYDVDYREFDGGHVVPPEMVDAALARFLN